MRPLLKSKKADNNKLQSDQHCLGVRDRELLMHVYCARFLSLAQVSRCYFGGNQLAYRHLSRLAKFGYLKRAPHKIRVEQNGRSRYRAIALYTITAMGMKAIDVPVHRVSMPADVDFRLLLNDMVISLMQEGIHWQYGYELKREQMYRPGIPLCGIANGDTLVFRCQKAFQASLIYDFYLDFYYGYKVVVILDDLELRDVLINAYPGGSVRIVAMGDVPWLLPKLIRSPRGYLEDFLQGFGFALPEGCACNSHVVRGNAIYAELVTGDMEAVVALRGWPNDNRHVLVRNGQPLPGGYCVYECSVP